jgi:imidazolonepropionase-like amidohydrolase
VDSGVTEAGTWISSPPADAELLPGRFAVPGLVDAHCHLAVARNDQGEPAGVDLDTAAANLAAARSAGVTAIRDTGSPGRITIQLLARQGEGGLFVSGRFLAPAGQYYPLLHDPVPADHLIDAALAEVAAGARWVKLIGDFMVIAPDGARTSPVPTYPIADVRQLVDAVHAAGARVAAHTTTAHVKALIEAGIDSVEHGLGLDADDLAALAARGGAWTPTLCAVTAPPTGPDDPERRAQRAEFLDRLSHLLPLAAGLGVTVMAGTDVAGTVADEVALLAKFGLEPPAALTAASTGARSFFGLPATIADGELADVVTYHEDPRDDLDTLARPAAVVARGVRIR